jgi:hypothetical protein
MRPIRHRIRGNSIFVETENSGTHGCEKLSWGACYAATLTGSKSSRFRIYADHAVMLRPFLKDAPAFPGYKEEWDQSVIDTEADPPGRWEPSDFIDAYQAVWRNPSPMGFTNFYAPAGTILNPGMPRPIVKAEIPGYYAWVMRRVPHIQMALLDRNSFSPLGIKEVHIRAIDLLALLCCRIRARNVEITVLHEVVIGIAAARFSPARKPRVTRLHQSTALRIRWGFGMDLFDAVFKILGRLRRRPTNIQP